MQIARVLCGLIAVCLLKGARGTQAQPLDPPTAHESAAPSAVPTPLVPVEQLSAAPALLAALQAAAPTTAGPQPAPLEAARPSTAALARAPALLPATEDHLSAEPEHAAEAAALREEAAYAYAPKQACPTGPSATDLASQPTSCLHATSLTMVCAACCSQQRKVMNDHHQSLCTGLQVYHGQSCLCVDTECVPASSMCSCVWQMQMVLAVLTSSRAGLL